MKNKILILGSGNKKDHISQNPNDEFIYLDKIPGDNVDIVCNLGFQSIPLEDGSIDEIIAKNVLHFIPKVVWEVQYVTEEIGNLNEFERKQAKESLQRAAGNADPIPLDTEVRAKRYVDIQPFAFLMNDIYRIAKHESILYISTTYPEHIKSNPLSVNYLEPCWFLHFNKKRMKIKDIDILCDFKSITDINDCKNIELLVSKTKEDLADIDNKMDHYLKDPVI